MQNAYKTRSSTDKPRLSVLVPVFNEERTIGEILGRLRSLPIALQIVVVDNGSTDKTYDVARPFAERGEITLVRHTETRGKGAAIRAGLPLATAEFVVIQDGDLEYDPGDLARLLELAESQGADAVFGSRNLNPRAGISYQRYYWGGRFLTWLANRLFGVGITDEATCYKLVRRKLLNRLDLHCERFEFCPEVVAKLGLLGVRIHELPIAYYPRSIAEGKKIRWRDGLEAIWTLVRWAALPGKFGAAPEDRQAESK